ncbi:MAG: roadblock/LC7 domain-containing protein [Deinococcales bacterium]
MSGATGPLQDALRELLRVRGVTSVAVAGADGGFVEGLALGEDELAALQELIPTALASSRALGGLLGEGAVQQALVEYAEGPVLLAPIEAGAGEDRAHVAVVGLADVSDLGRVRFQLKRRLPALARALGEPEGA